MQSWCLMGSFLTDILLKDVKDNFVEENTYILYIFPKVCSVCASVSLMCLVPPTQKILIIPGKEEGLEDHMS